MTEVVSSSEELVFLPQTPLAMSEMSTPGSFARRQSPKEATREEWDLPLPKHVDNLEWLLADALLAYRGRVEEALLGHMEAMESCEAKYQLENANLRAENAMLRGKLGLGSTSVDMFQNVVMAAAPKEKAQKKSARLTFLGASSSASASPPGDQEFGGSRTGKRNGSPSRNMRVASQQKGKKVANGGSWQQFVAWVPTGTGLQQPEPWKPLPGDTAIQPMNSNLKPPMLGIPSTLSRQSGQSIQVSSQASQRAEAPENDDDGNSESSTGTHKEDRQDSGGDKWKVLEMWRCPEKDLTKLRLSHASKHHVPESGHSVVPHHGRGTFMRGFSSPRDSLRTSGLMDIDFTEAIDGRGKCLIHPQSRKRFVWDIMSLWMVMYDMVMVPMTLFTLPASDFLVAMEWMTRLFWTLDIVLSMRTAVILKDGSANFEWKYIMKRYLRSWFLLDAVIVTTDWCEVLVEAGEVSSLSRAYRSLRVMRLLRSFRMQVVLQTICERTQSDLLVFGFCIFKTFLFILCISHVMACIWWGIGVGAEAGKTTWVDESQYGNKPLELQYLVSLHWSLSQFTGGMDEVTPRNTIERFFAVLVWLFTFMATAIMVSILTSNLTQLHIIGGIQSRQLATLRKFMKQNSISSNLALRMQRSAQCAISGDLAQDVVEILPLVSEPLRVEMHCEMYLYMMRANHQFFAEFCEESPLVMRKICHYAVHSILLIKDDMLFTQGDAPADPKMYFIAKGSLDYTYPSTCRGVNETCVVSERQNIGEAVLWTRWIYVGTLVSSTESKVAALEAKKFHEIIIKEGGDCDLKLYAADFVARLNVLASTESLITDLTQL